MRDIYNIDHRDLRQREEAILVDIEHGSDVNIANAIRPTQLAREIDDYLSPRRRRVRLGETRH